MTMWAIRRIACLGIGATSAPRRRNVTEPSDLLYNWGRGADKTPHELIQHLCRDYPKGVTRVGNKRTAEGDSSLLRPLPNRRQERRSTAPSFLGCPGSLYVLDLLMRHRVYVGIQVSSDGGVLGFTILDGQDRRRAWVHSDDELAELFRSLTERYDTPIEP